MSVVVAFGGPPHSGKSVFTEAVYARALQLVQGTRQVFRIPANPDGEGAWYHDIPNEEAERLRRPQDFSEEFRRRTLTGIQNARKTISLCLVDLGGRVGKDTEAFVQAADYLVLLVSLDKQSELQSWRELGPKVGTKLLAEFHTEIRRDAAAGLSLDARSSLDLSEIPFKGTLVNLERGQIGQACYSDAVDAFTGRLLEMAQNAAEGNRKVVP